MEGGLPGGDPVSPCPSAWLWGPLPLVQAAGRWVRSQAHSRVKALPSGPLQALAWLCCSGCGSAPGFCSQLVASVLNSLVWFGIVSLRYGPK